MANEHLRPEVMRALDTLDRLRARGEVAAFYLTSERQPTIRTTVIRSARTDVQKVHAQLESLGIPVEATEIDEPKYYFLGGELRPGTGIIRRAGGRVGGPSGTLTCFLSSLDSKDYYFAAAGHVATNFWRIPLPDDDGAIFLNRKGYPGTNSMRFLGKLFSSSLPPRRMDKEPTLKKTEPTLDIALIKMAGNFDLRQRTTCYGHFGEWPGDDPEDPIPDDLEVMKCGAEEVHWTAAVVKEVGCTVYVYGPDMSLYQLHKQVILEQRDGQIQRSPSRQNNSGTKTRGYSDPHNPRAKESSTSKELPNNPPRTPFGVAGDSGSMVVDRVNKRPVGMLIAGSALEGEYVMTPISAISKYWKERNLVLLRA